jgi:site-specific recombinase XerD
MKTRKGWLVKRGAIWYATWEVSGKRFQKTTGERDERKAKSRLAEIMRPFLVEDEVRTLESIAARIQGAKTELATMDEQRNPPLTVAEAWTAYDRAANRREISDVTMRTYQSNWQTFAEWIAEKRPDVVQMRQVSFAVAEEYWQHLIGTRVTGRTCNGHRTILRRIFAVLADKARLSEGNPWAKIAKRDEHRQSRRPLTVEELRNVCRGAEGELRVLLALGLYLGARMGDCACMDWGNVDMVRRLIRYTPRKIARRHPEPLEIPMHHELVAIMGEIPAAKRHGPVCPELAALYRRRGSEGVSDIVQRHFDACKLTTTSERNGAGVRRVVQVGFHSLRHSEVSFLRQAGAAQSVSQAFAGHNSPEVHALYTHTDEDAMRRAVGTLPAVMHDGPTALLPADSASGARSAMEVPWYEALRKIVEQMKPRDLRAQALDILARAAGNGAAIVAT